MGHQVVYILAVPTASDQPPLILKADQDELLFYVDLQEVFGFGIARPKNGRWHATISLSKWR